MTAAIMIPIDLPSPGVLYINEENGRAILCLPGGGESSRHRGDSAAYRPATRVPASSWDVYQRLAPVAQVAVL